MFEQDITTKQLQEIVYQLLDEMVNGILIIKNDRDHYPIIFANKALEGILGRTIGTMRKGNPDSFLDLIYISDQNRAKNALNATELTSTIKESYRLRTISGTNLWMLATHKCFFTDAQEEYLAIDFSNIHELMDAQNRLKADSTKWSDIVNNIPIGLVIFHMDLESEECRVIAVNHRLVVFSNEVGKNVDGNTREWSPQELAVILSQNIYSFSIEDDIPGVRRMLNESVHTDVTSCNFRLRGSTPEHCVWIRSTCHSKLVEGDRVFYVTFSDSTAEITSMEKLKQSHEQLRILSYQDTLSGLYNRNAINELCDVTFKNPLENVGIVFADLNGLKRINDTFGHRFGDRMIQRFGKILTKEFSPQSCYRISGDEFVVVAPNIDKEIFKERMNAIVADAYDADEIASIGYLWEKNVTDVRQVVEAAEQLMYVEKQRYYSTEEVRVSKRKNTYLTKLVEEIERGQYVCYLQPKSDIRNHVVIGAEALIRKYDRDGNLLTPNFFIPILEHERLIPRIDFFMLEEVCKILRRWEDEGRRPVKISVNMSRVTLSEHDYIERLVAICDKYQINRSLLELEITESNATMDHNLLIDEVEQISALGIGVSLDDMGTEYSSLRMMTLNGIDTVKLDRSFINQMPNKQGYILVKQMIILCQEMGLHCIAEGVETEEQREELSSLGCEFYQGYLLSKPIPVADFEDLAEKSYQ